MLLETRDLRAGYGGVVVLHGVNLAVPADGFTVLLGANGAGKTTTLRAICGLARASGEIWFDGERIDGLAAEEIARRGIAHVPEGRGTFAELTVAENLRLGGYLRRAPAVRADFDRIFCYFPVLAGRLRQAAGTLSGGEQQMLALARALLSRPKALLLDEPSFGLAPQVTRDMFALLRRISRDERIGGLIVEQNANLALSVAEQAYVMETGRIVMSGPAAAIREHEAIRRSYLGY